MPLPSSLEHARPVADQASRLLAFLQYSNLHIFVVALGLLAGTSALFDVALSIPVLIAGSCGAFLLYQLDRCWFSGQEDEANQPLRVAWITQHKRYVWLSSGAALTAGLIGAGLLTDTVRFVGMLLACCGVAYLLPLQKRLKRIWYVKPAVIAGAWALGAVALPIVAASVSFTSAVIVFLGYRFFFIVPNVLLADWQDTAGDHLAGLNSLAMFVDERTLRLIAAASAVFALVFGIWAGQLLAWPMLYYLDLLGPLLMLFFCLRRLRTSYVLYGLLLDLVVAWPLVTALVVYNW